MEVQTLVRILVKQKRGQPGASRRLITSISEREK